MMEEDTAERIAALIHTAQERVKDLAEDLDPEADAQIARGLAELHEKRSVKKIIRIRSDE